MSHPSVSEGSSAHHQPVGGDTRASSRRVIAGLAACILGYAVSLVLGHPQYGRDLIVAEQADQHHEAADHGDRGDHEASTTAPAIASVVPFVLLLAAIAVFPLVPSIAHWWEHNANRLLVACLLGGVTLGYYLFVHDHPVDLHFPAHAVTEPAAAGPSWGLVGTVLVNALLAEYVPFIALLFALYCVTGGVRIEGDLEATPTTNAGFIATGGLLASLIGTTGAAMLLVRPLVETNRERRRVAHTLVFFIFACCRSATRRCFSATCRGSTSSGRSRCGSPGC